MQYFKVKSRTAAYSRLFRGPEISSEDSSSVERKLGSDGDRRALGLASLGRLEVGEWMIKNLGR